MYDPIISPHKMISSSTSNFLCYQIKICVKNPESLNDHYASNDLHITAYHNFLIQNKFKSGYSGCDALASQTVKIADQIQTDIYWT